MRSHLLCHGRSGPGTPLSPECMTDTAAGPGSNAWQARDRRFAHGRRWPPNGRGPGRTTMRIIRRTPAPRALSTNYTRALFRHRFVCYNSLITRDIEHAGMKYAPTPPQRHCMTGMPHTRDCIRRHTEGARLPLVATGGRSANGPSTGIPCPGDRARAFLPSREPPRDRQ